MENTLWKVIIIAIIVHLPEERKSVAIPSCNNLAELSSHESGSLNKLAYSHIFFQKLLGYLELIRRGEITHAQAEEHMEGFANLYNANILDFDADEDDEISMRVHKVMSEEDFGINHSVFLRAVSGEIFRIFASGALSYEEGDAELALIPSHMHQHVPTQA